MSMTPEGDPSATTFVLVWVAIALAFLTAIVTIARMAAAILSW